MSGFLTLILTIFLASILTWEYLVKIFVTKSFIKFEELSNLNTSNDLVGGVSAFCALHFVRVNICM